MKNNKLSNRFLKKDFWVNSIPVAALLIGMFFLIIAYFFIHESEKENLKELCKVIGTTILASGIFSFMIKYARFSEIFKDELLEIIYGASFLENQKNILEIWERVSGIIFKNKFPHINKYIFADVKNIYFPTAQSLYYKDYTQTLEIELLDKVNQIISVNQHMSFTIVKPETELPISLSSRNVISFHRNSDDVKFVLKELKINNKLKEAEVIRKIVKNDLISTYEIQLEREDEHKIDIKIEKEYSLLYDNVISLKKDFIISNFTLRILCNEDIDFNFLSCGTLNEFEHKSFKKSKDYNYKGLIYPKQGFIIIMKLKQ